MKGQGGHATPVVAPAASSPSVRSALLTRSSARTQSVETAFHREADRLKASAQGRSNAKITSVILVIPSFRMGGAEHQAVQYAVGLKNRGVSLVVCAIDGAGPLRKLVEESGIRFVALHRRKRSRRRLTRILQHGVGLLRLVRLAGALKPDVIHSFMTTANIYAAFATRWGWRSACLIVAQRNLGLSKREHPLLALGERWASHHAAVVHVNSDAVGRAAIANEGLPPSKVVRIYNGVDVGKYSPGPIDAFEKTSEAHTPTLAIVANLHKHKDHAVMIRALPRIMDLFPSIQLLCIGEDRGQRRPLEHLAKDLEVDAHVHFIGHQDRIPELLRSVDLVIHPSLQEGFPNAVLEAMSCGKPVVASRVGGTVEAVVDGVTGILVEPGDADALADAVIKLLQDPERSRKMGLAGRERVLVLFSIDHAVAQLESLYLELCNGPVGHAVKSRERQARKKSKERGSS